MGKSTSSDMEGMGMKAMGLMPHHDRFPYLSRDWEDIDCRSKVCAYNRNGKCTVPSMAKIGESGRCEGFIPLGTVKVKDDKPE